MNASIDDAVAEMVALLPRLRRFARALTGQHADADDLVQDTIERALRNLSQWAPGTRLDSWMYRIAQNLWIDRHRAERARGGPSRSLDEAMAITIGGQPAAESRMLLRQTMHAFQELPEEQRVVAALILVEGASYGEAAKILAIPLGTVTSRLARAREFLAQRVLGGSKEREILS